MYRYYCLLALSAVLCSVALPTATAAPLEGGVDPSRVREIAAALDDAPFAFGPRITDRAAWERLAQHKAFENVIELAERKVAEPMPPLTLEIYSLYAKTGQRTRQYGDVISNRRSRVTLYTLAECFENKGRFIQPLELVIAELCAEPTWIFNFHDTAKLDDWHGRRTFIDLGSSIFSGDLAQAMVVLGDRLSPETRARITANCRRRTLAPYVQAVEQGGGQWWINSDMNWNSVCHNGVVATALAIAETREERAWFLASAEKFTRNYLRGFGPDGYCNEGMGYWNYGFTHFAEMSERVFQATGAKLSFYDLPNARAAALYPTNLELQQGAFPSYADCALNSQPAARLSSFLSRQYQVPMTRAFAEDLTVREGGLSSTLMYSFPRPEIAIVPPKSATAPAQALRSFFDHGGVLTCRPAAGSASKMAVSLKGGHNAEAHNHNDLGTFVVAIDNELLILDPGGEVYTSRTFGKDRYKSNLLNSFGHPVPVLAGQLQREGREAAAKVLKTDFADTRDVFTLDLATAYRVPELQLLTREFTYHRTGEGSLTVLDDFRFTSPQSYGTALLTYKKIEVQPDNSILIRGDAAAVLVRIETDRPFEIVQQVIEEQTHTGVKPTRIGINLREPISQGQVKLTITPAAK